MISGLFIVNAKGDPLISKLYRQDIKRNIIDLFRIHVIGSPSPTSPIFKVGSTTFYFVKHENIFIISVCKSNANVPLVFELMYRLCSTLSKVIPPFNEQSVKENFLMIYEMLDEICDFGFPQNTEIGSLSMILNPDSLLNSPTTPVSTNAVSWRRADILYKKNEFFCDVVESLNLLINAQQEIISADIDGEIPVKCLLSGMPECKLTINDKPLSNQKSVKMRNSQFHQCVNLDLFNSERSIVFIPPDGEFNLMTYKITEDVVVPFKIHPLVTELNDYLLDYKVAIRSMYNEGTYAENIALKIPVPTNTANCELSVSKGKAKYSGAEHCIIWKMPRMAGSREHLFTAKVELTKTTNTKQWTKPPISIDFQVVAFTASGLSIRSLK